MQVQSYDATDERTALVALCLNSEVLGKVSHGFPEEPFAGKFSNLIARWCLTHFKQYGEAPGVYGLTAIHASWSSGNPTKGDPESVSKILNSLPPNMEMSVDYAVDLINNIILRTKLKRTAEQITGALSNGKVEAAAKLVEAFERPALGTTDSENDCFLFERMDDIEDTLNATSSTSLIQFPDRLKELRDFFGPTLSRDAFVGILAPEKGGKSVVLGTLGIRAAMQGLRVAYMNLGDLSERQYRKRFYTAICGKPAFPCTYKIPTEISYKDKEPTVKFDTRSDHGYSAEDIRESITKFQGSDARRFRLCSSPAGKIDVFDIRHKLETWAKAGWTPDVMVVDYADIIGFPSGVKEKIEAVDITWRELRALSTEFHCLVITATQSTRTGYNSWLLSKSDVSDSKTKTAHVTAMVGVNVTEAERRLQTCRLNYIALREAEFTLGNPASVVAVSGCHSIGRPFHISGWVN
jgi:hypothetical protein